MGYPVWVKAAEQTRQMAAISPLPKEVREKLAAQAEREMRGPQAEPSKRKHFTAAELEADIPDLRLGAAPWMASE